MKALRHLFWMLFLATAAVGAADESPLSVAGATTIDTAQAKTLFEKRAVFVDLRKESEYDAGRIPGTYSMFINTAFNRRRWRPRSRRTTRWSSTATARSARTAPRPARWR
jgi:hypothetical protein